jgi:hypothetical protein
VDGQVAAWLIEHVLGPRGLLGGKLRLVATSQLEVARDASQIVVLRDGEVREHGLQPYVLQAATVCGGRSPMTARCASTAAGHASRRTAATLRGCSRRVQASAPMPWRHRRCTRP